MQDYKMWIDGKLVNAESGKTLGVINPATEEEFTRIPLGDKADVDKAVAAARKAFPIWSKKPQAERSRILNQMALSVKEHAKELALLETLDHGTPSKRAYFMPFRAADHFEYAAQVSRAILGDVIPVKTGTFCYVQREPIGVCALITPWNVPLMMVAAKLGPALAVGNTCIVKPPSIDSLAALKLGEILEKIELPPGTINIITGPGDTVGEALVSHPGVDKVSFTGSCETGKSIMSCASGTVKPVSLELGGKNPFIVLEDADVDAAVDGAIDSAFRNTGMVCASPGRYYIHERVYDEFLEKFVAAANNIAVGDPTDSRTQMGPVVSAEHRDKVEGYIKSGIEEGAKLLLGGKRPLDPPLNKGYFVMPTVFTHVTQNMKIAREEIFGPVVCIMKFSSNEDVLALANDNTFGLSASVWTKNMAKALQYANELRVGFVWINDHLTLSSELPWGGFRESGFGKENSIYGLYEYTQLKVIYAELSEEKKKPWHAL
jgi:acyl-CoA reductase-like NAD-dependent aldehyde dehydrogenase